MTFYKLSLQGVYYTHPIKTILRTEISTQSLTPSIHLSIWTLSQAYQDLYIFTHWTDAQGDIFGVIYGEFHTYTLLFSSQLAVKQLLSMLHTSFPFILVVVCVEHSVTSLHFFLPHPLL